MTTATNQPYQNPGWQNSPWGRPASGNQGGNQPWSEAPFWHPAGLGRPIAIAAIVFLLAAGHIGRMLFWPIALAGLVFMVATGRFGCRRRRWAQQNQDGQSNNQGNTWQSCMPWARAWGGWGGGNGGGDQTPTPRSSGNHAFDEYRAETLRRLEEEQNEFSSFLERLRFAKDKAEFDQFMAERRQTPRPPAVPDEPLHQG
jgi:hypothetical protein